MATVEETVQLLSCHFDSKHYVVDLKAAMRDFERTP